MISRSTIVKKVEVESIPDHTENYCGGLPGINLLDKVMPIIMKSKTTLLFTNTHVHKLKSGFALFPETTLVLAGQVALHHGSPDREIRAWVEENLHLWQAPLVICTSSPWLSVDLRPWRQLSRSVAQKVFPGFCSELVVVATGWCNKQNLFRSYACDRIDRRCLAMAWSKNKIEERIPIVQAFDVGLNTWDTGRGRWV